MKSDKSVKDILELTNAKSLFSPDLQVKKSPRFSQRQAEANRLIGEDIKNGAFPRTKKEFKKRYAKFFKKYKSWPEIDPTTFYDIERIYSEIKQEILKKYHEEYIQGLKSLSAEKLKSRIEAYEERLKNPDELSCVLLDKMLVCTSRESARQTLKLLIKTLREKELQEKKK
jgi:hypothetical protein